MRHLLTDIQLNGSRDELPLIPTGFALKVSQKYNKIPYSTVLMHRCVFIQTAIREGGLWQVRAFFERMRLLLTGCVKTGEHGAVILLRQAKQEMLVRILMFSI